MNCVLFVSKKLFIIGQQEAVYYWSASSCLLLVSKIQLFDDQK
jgi:hypothetical protein